MAVTYFGLDGRFACIGCHTKTISYEEREAQKATSRKRDALDLATGKKTHEQLCQENLCVRLTGARIDFSKSASRYW